MPAVTFGNYRSIQSKINEQRANCRFMYQYREACCLAFTETWLDERTPDAAIETSLLSYLTETQNPIKTKGQAQLEFLPERDTDFIFAVMGEEMGLLGVLSLLGLYMFIVGRSLYIAIQARDTYSRLLSGSISLTFFVYVFVNTAMVTGLVPVVGVPLPLVSFGGTSMVTLMAGFGILMSIHNHRKLLPH